MALLSIEWRPSTEAREGTTMRAGPMIPVEEYAGRRERAAGLVAEAGFDVLVANGTDSDASNVRYFSAYWPLFEMGGISPSGRSMMRA
jgi:hypothetical protein